MTFLGHDNGLWFTNNHVEVAVSHRDHPDGISVLRLTMPFDEAPPLHVHHAEEEIFHILEGEIRFSVGGAKIVKRAGDTLLAPRGVPHGFRVVSREGARMLVIMRGGFEEMVRAASRPAAIAGLPDQVPPTPEMQADLAHQCARRQIEILGPPIA